MKQYNIKYINKLENALKELGYTLLEYSFFGNQFKSCQAWEINANVVDDKTGEIIKCECLQSYETLVAIIVNGVLVRGKYSTTTSKQITQWSNRKDYKGVYNY